MSSLFEQFDYLATVDSTNDYLKAYVEDGQPRLAVAEEQTKGKGRHGRSWYSPGREGLYVSYLMYPGWEVAREGFLNAVSALAVLKTIRHQGVDKLALRLKPPNDILIEGKKVCGILTELGTLKGRISWAIVGIGVNLYQESFPAQLGDKATSLRLQGVELETALDFCEVLTREIEQYYREVEEGAWDRIQAEFQRMSSR